MAVSAGKCEGLHVRGARRFFFFFFFLFFSPSWFVAKKCARVCVCVCVHVWMWLSVSALSDLGELLHCVFKCLGRL